MQIFVQSNPRHATDAGQTDSGQMQMQIEQKQTDFFHCGEPDVYIDLNGMYVVA